MLYKLLTSKITVEGQEYITYGIKGKNISFADVSTDRAKTEEMIERINREQLDECHLLEFIEDELIR